jgi:hypothetical protein
LRMGTTNPGAPPKTPRLVAPEDSAYHALQSRLGGQVSRWGTMSYG